MATTAGVGATGLGHLRLPERYQVARRIASGGMASVWCAEDRVLGRSVAVKVLSEAIAHDPAARGRFKREARAAAHLSGHPNVVTIYDVGDADPARPFIVMEYLDGGSVAKALRLKDVKRAEAVRLLDSHRSLHVADFGIARLGTEEAITKSGDVLGTAAYIAPERALGGPATEASDRYAFAVTAFELLVGERPFNAGLVAAQARQHIEDEPPRASERNPALPASLDAVLARGMAKRPEDRFPSAQELAVAVERALTTRTPRAATTTSGEWSPLVRSDVVKPPRRGIAIAALLAAVLAAVVVVLATQSGGTNPVKVTATRSHTPAAKAAKHHGHAKTTPPATVTASTATSAASLPAGPAQGTPAPTGPSTPAPAGQSADALEAQGHQLTLAGNYAAAVPVLRQAVAAASPSSLTYAYALYDLGHALRLSGDPEAAIPILRKRLEIPNQLPVVRAEYEAALRAAHQHP
jgi:serine/threonine protein kinase